jgi:hypothetical protein
VDTRTRPRRKPRPRQALALVFLPDVEADDGWMASATPDIKGGKTVPNPLVLRLLLLD